MTDKTNNQSEQSRATGADSVDLHRAGRPLAETSGVEKCVWEGVERTRHEWYIDTRSPGRKGLVCRRCGEQLTPMPEPARPQQTQSMKTKPKVKTATKAAKPSSAEARRSLERMGSVWIMSGDGSVPLWKDINGATTIPKLRSAIYHLACRCQLLESEIKALSTAAVSHAANVDKT